MTIETKKVMIGEREFCITELPVTQSIHLMLEITKAIGEPMASIAPLIMKALTEPDSAPDLGKDDIFFNKIGSALMNIEPDLLVIIIKKICERNVGLDNKGVNIDRDFTGKLDEVFTLIVEALKFHYRSFFLNSSSLSSAIKNVN